MRSCKRNGGRLLQLSGRKTAFLFSSKTTIQLESLFERYKTEKGGLIPLPPLLQLLTHLSTNAIRTSRFFTRIFSNRSQHAINSSLPAKAFIPVICTSMPEGFSFFDVSLPEDTTDLPELVAQTQKPLVSQRFSNACGSQKTACLWRWRESNPRPEH